ncbi:MAG: sigma-70 family RNA polymerase sigma factor [Bacteroidales bacterium]|nr:sigma-70 family RNA polymerase sigma factor [Bacteroidales bacterium]
MMAVCRRYVPDVETAKDVLQEGFVTLFDKIGSYKGDGSFEGWVRRIFVNKALMQLRKNDALKFSDDIALAETIDNPRCNTIEDIQVEELMKLINALPQGFRTVFNLYVIEGFDHSEISKMLKISEGTSRSQLSRARTWLLERIKRNE